MRPESTPRSVPRTAPVEFRDSTLLSERQLERVLHRERQRCDRCQADVALIRVEFAPAALGLEEPLQGLLGSIFGRVRLVDELGWLAPGVLGILLPETDGEGAWTLLGDLLDGDANGLLCASRIGVYAYPEVLPEDMRPARGARPAPGARREPGEPTHAG